MVVRAGSVAAIALAALVVSPAVARGDGGVTVAVHGSCPGPAQMVAALDAEKVSLDPRGLWTVRVVSRDGRARLDLVRPGGGRAAVRIVDSDDCVAVAEAFALIVVAGIRAAPMSTVGARTVAPALDVEPPSLSARRGAPPPADLGRRVWGGMVGALAFAEPSVGGLRIDAGWVTRGGTRLRGVVQVESGADYYGFDPGAGPFERALLAERSQTALTAEVGAATHSGPWSLGVWGGGGAAISRVTTRESGTVAMRESVLRMHPVLAASIEGGLDLNPIVRARAIAGTHFFPVNDRYYLPSGQFESPRLQVLLGVGISIQFAGEGEPW